AYRAACHLVKRRHIGRWRWRRCAEDIGKNPLTAQYRRRAVGIRGHGEHAALAKEPTPRRIAERHPAELISINVRNPIVLGQAFVYERVIGSKQVHYTAIFTHDTADEQLGLSEKGLAKIVVKIGKHLLIGRRGFQIPQIEPLAKKIGKESLRT